MVAFIYHSKASSQRKISYLWNIIASSHQLWCHFNVLIPKCGWIAGMDFDLWVEHHEDMCVSDNVCWAALLYVTGRLFKSKKMWRRSSFVRADARRCNACIPGVFPKLCFTGPTTLTLIIEELFEITGDLPLLTFLRADIWFICFRFHSLRKYF